jgi:hypothetical protein
MSYISRRLAAGESIVYEGRFHFFQKLVPWLALLLLGVFIVGIVIWAGELIRQATTRWAVTNRRVMLKRGFFQVHMDELTLESIEGAHVDQSILGRMFGFGKLTLRGRGDTHIEFPTMDKPSHFRAAIEDARMNERRPIDVAPAEPEPPIDETRGERKRRLREERRLAERERRVH